MVDLLGTGYVADYCISRFRKKQEDKAYRNYITDALMYINNNFTTRYGGTTIALRYRDIIDPPVIQEAGEIVKSVMSAGGLKFAEDE